MSEIPEKSGEIQEIRDDKGRFVPGVSGNPAGKPVGAKHMSTLLLEAIKKVAVETGTREDEEIVRALIARAKSGDTKAIDMIFDRTEGKAPQTLDVNNPDGNLKTIIINKSKV